MPRLVDDPDWLTTALATSTRLPPELCEELRRFRHDPGKDAVLLIHDLPLHPDVLPPTPAASESVERRATRTTSILALIALQLGELVAFRDEKAGALLQNVVPVPGQEVEQSNAGSARLEMHVENAFHPYRPDLVMLLCLRSDHESEAGLLVASARRAAALLRPETKQVLGQPQFRTEPPPSFSGTAESVDHPVFSGDMDDPNIRVDFTSTHPRSDAARTALAELEAAFRSVACELKLNSGDLVIVDNRLAVHGRTAFTPRYDGQDRWLQRAFVHFDYRRSRGERPDDGCVLD
jgi:L-asparagine oxygenase